ncbi:MAG TPA: phosphatase PAP2 family protein [Verrucomicrobiae bacterium]|nr:phosphatase PAP2 family protein [Verrucomicrobiae bacterium]
MESEPESKTAASSWKQRGLEFCHVWHGGWSRLWPRLWIVLLAAGIGMLLVAFFSSADNALLRQIQVKNETVTSVARYLSDYSDRTVPLGAPLGLFIWMVGVVRRNVRWRKLGIACLIATLVAGLIVDVFRVATGRTRPYVKEPDRFHWFSTRSAYQSFPSGHTGVASATATVLAVAVPELTIPCVAFGGAVAWSRLQLNAHHPTDVTVSFVIGIVCGLSFGSAVPGVAIRLRRRKRKKKLPVKAIASG